MAAEQEPNLFALNGRALHVTFSSTSFDGTPRLTYQDALATLQFSGDEIRQDNTEMGLVVSVTTVRTIDSGSTTFSLILPRVRLLNGQPAHIRTFGITTLHRFSIVLPMHGQLDTYRVQGLSGTVSFVEF